MSTPAEKSKNALRRFRDETVIKKQLKIAKQHNFDKDILKEPHRFHKHHAMDCGNPDCGLCGNPRHIHKHGLTIQEQKFYQDMDSVRDNRSNGLSEKDELK